MVAVVELVVTEGADVELECVADLEQWRTAEDCGDGGALNEVAAMDKDAVGAVGALALGCGVEVSPSTGTVGVRQEPGVEIVGVEDGEAAEIPGRCCDRDEE